jgi:ABC-type multidrug transport system fused ATPase/permease subunit
MKRLFKLILKKASYRWLLFFAVVSMLLLAVASQLEIISLGIITRNSPEMKGNGLVDRVIRQVNDIVPISDNVSYLAIFLVCVALFKATTLFAQRYTTRLIAIELSRDLRQNYFEHIQLLPMEFYQKYHIGTLSSRAVGDAAMIAEAINACLINYLQTPFTIVTTLSLCFLASWKLSLIIFFGFPLIIFPIIFLAKRVKRVSKQIQKNQETFASILIDFLAGIQTVKVFAMENFSLKKYREQNEKMAMLERKSARYDLSSRPIIHTVAMSFLAVTMLYGLYGLQMNVADVLVYCGLLYLFYEPIKKFAEENSHIQRGIAAAERMYDVMNQHPQIQDHAGALSMEGFHDAIEFKDVWFRYEENWILKGVTFKVKKGQTVAIIGPTGSGKSTIVQLLPRLYDIEKGEIHIDGKTLDSYTQRSLRESIAFVPQKPFLFYDTVAANISYGRPFSDEEIKEAACKAHADEFICKLPEGYQFELAEAGKNLSGGQQQRLAIARALVKKAPILVMDEATSSLDVMSENHIKTALNQLKGQVTQIIIAHRLSTIADADKIIYLDHGVKVAEGTKDELLVSCPAFKQMWMTMNKSNE